MGVVVEEKQKGRLPSTLVGVVVGLLMVSLKVAQLGEEKHWEFFRDAPRVWHVDELLSVVIIVLEALIAAAATKVVTSYVFNNISHTITQIFNQVAHPDSPKPDVVRIDPETRSWLQELSGEALDRARAEIAARDNRVDALQAELAALRAQFETDVAKLNATLVESQRAHAEQLDGTRSALERSQQQNQQLKERLTSVQRWFQKFATVFEESKTLSQDVIS